MGWFPFGKNKKSKKGEAQPEEEAPKMFENIQEKPLQDQDRAFIEDQVKNADVLIYEFELYQGEIK